MVWCYYCRKEIPDEMVGLINFALSNHRCPALEFEHCPHCGKDIDTSNVFWGYDNRHILTEKQIREILNQK